MNGYGQLTSCSCGKTEMNGSGDESPLAGFKGQSTSWELHRQSSSNSRSDTTTGQFVLSDKQFYVQFCALNSRIKYHVQFLFTAGQFIL